MKLIGKTQEGEAIVQLSERDLIRLKNWSSRAGDWYKEHNEQILYNLAAHYYGELEYILDQI